MVTNIKRAQHNLKIIRRFEEDIWGILAIKNKPSKVLNYLYEAYQNTFKYRKLLKTTKRSFFIKKKARFLYKVITGEKEFRRKKQTLKIKSYLNLLKLRRFYGNIGKRKFKKSFQTLSIKSNVSTQSFAYFLESRLDVILYRANFFKSIFAARQYISHKKVYVNGNLIAKSGYRVKVDDVVCVKDPLFFYWNLKSSLKKRFILGNYPSYLYVNYKLGLIKLISLPKNELVPFPFFVDIKSINHNLI